MVAGHQLGFGLGQIERRAVTFGQRAGHGDEEGHERGRILRNTNQSQG
jgi:hypothetical protein